MNDGINLFEYLIPGYATISLFKWLAVRIGCHEAALRLLFSLLLSYPLCIFYNISIVKQSLTVKNLYLFISGISIGFFNYGFNIFHTLAAIIITFMVIKYFGASKFTAITNFIFCMTYLLWGYYKTQTDEYAFEWTIPQCVLTLRLISLSFDYYDGQMELKRRKKNDDHGDDDDEKLIKNNDSSIIDNGDIDKKASHIDTLAAATASAAVKRARSETNNEDAIYLPLTLLQVLSYSYFPGSFLVGPQFSYKRYLSFISDTDNHLPICLNHGLKKLVYGLLYLAFYQIGSLYWPLKFLLSPNFEALNGFLLKFTVAAITMKIQLCKYLSIWLISEGCCIISGLTYDKETGKFSGCSNVDIWEFETTPSFAGLIRSFNITTNNFASKHIFKRLKFLGSKPISQISTLFFLAIWHGWQTGYYVTFSMEFLIMKMEWEVTTKMKKLREKYTNLDKLLNSMYIKYSLHILMRIYLMYMFAYCLIPFTLLTSYKWYPVLSQLYFSGHILYTSWFLVSFLL